MLHDYASFYGEESSAPRPTPKLEDHPFYAVRDILVKIFAGRSSIRNPKTHHAVVTGTHFLEKEHILRL
jgi:hypothetical protein